MPVVLTILGDLFTLEERARIQGLFSAIWGGAALAGPALGALLVNTLGWRSIFYLNLPLGALAAGVLAWKYYDREKPHSTDLDLPGVGALSLACAALLLSVSPVGAGQWPWWISPALLGVAALAVVAFVRHERRVEHPIIDPALIVGPHIGPCLLGSMLIGVAIFGVDVYVPLYVQGGRGGGAVAAASVVTPVMLTWSLSNLLWIRLMVRWGFRPAALLGSIITVVAFGGLVACTALDAPHNLLTLVLGVMGFGFGPTAMSYILVAQNAVSWQQRGSVTSGVTFCRTIGGALGVGGLGAMFNLIIAPDLTRLRSLGAVPADVLDPHSQAHLAPEVAAQMHHAISHSLVWIFLAMLVLAVAQAFVANRLKPGTPGQELASANPQADGQATQSAPRQSIPLGH
jgi:MFS family permease